MPEIAEKAGKVGEMRSNIWFDCLQKGTKWEKKLMEKIGKIIQVKSVEAIKYSDYPEIQRQGIDGLISLETVKVETKTRTYQYYKFKDILLETLSVIEANKPGWFFTTQANVVAYVWETPTGTNLFDGYLIFITPQLREWFNQNQHRFRTQIAQTKNAGEKWTTENKVVPIKEFPKGSIKKFNPYLDLTEQVQLTVFFNNKKLEVENS